MQKLLPNRKGTDLNVINGKGYRQYNPKDKLNRREEKKARKNEDAQSRLEDPRMIEEIEVISDDKSSSIDSDLEEDLPPLTAQELNDALFFMPKDQELFMLHLNEACEDS